MKTIKMLCLFFIIFVGACDQKNKLTTFASASNLYKPKPEKQYVFGTDDIPLFQDLILIEDDSSNFDTMVGNIVISKYLGDVNLKAVKDFYLQTLPQLGWKMVENKADKISFKREKDKLEIKVSYASKGLYVRFLVSSILQ